MDYPLLFVVDTFCQKGQKVLIKLQRGLNIRAPDLFDYFPVPLCFTPRFYLVLTILLYSRSQRLSNLVFVALAENKQTLAEIIEPGEKDHTHEHRNVVAHFFARILQYEKGQRLCHAIGYEIAYGNIQGEAQNHLPRHLFIPERELAVEKKAQYARKEIIRAGRHPVAAPRYIIQAVHDGRAHKGIYQSDDDEPHKLFIKQRKYFFHDNPPLSARERFLTFLAV
jgi:hypothetical protein